MSKIVIHSVLLGLLALCLPAGPAQAQTVKNISVSNTESYTDHISLAKDSRDMDVMVKFMFDEAQNTLTVSVLSYRSLFVFREPALYGSVVRCSRIRPKLLPYVAEAAPKTHYILSPALRKTIPCPKGNHVFNRWVEYDGLQPAPADYKMVNDYIEQTFEILQKRSIVSVTLRDLFVMEPRANNPKDYVFLAGTDLNRKYQINIQRNPCLGREEEIETAVGACKDVSAAWRNLKKTFNGGEVANAESLKNFKDTQTLLLTQFPVRQEPAECPNLQQLVQQYNAYVDSISTMQCKIKEIDAPILDSSKSLDVKLVYSQARQLDKAVSRWMVSKDELERQDLVNQCREIISDMSVLLPKYSVKTDEEMKAVKAYKQAVQHFQNTCKK